ncbi:MAG: tetratricopeptide repeat protein [Akkermansiaceae bacterium]|jgi:Flp pilus assembly protein TadD|nr:tetratricopeptide repeat protein [Akkermansiaceae bacterium]MDP4647273.1 tetratricopeptide repeat protein [Akkermansiaceae bacterium]MDP4722501.1 tetratricopeptide repeat protein [Akkermansiaceae bacterium]MDP4781053.1 tetratricopeptide repeat protein [Akkermansiaceae bacterium]MDP4848513.1 tetratricopeptide repeat protein [Akkermansiaceae bacterium]
MSEPSIEYYNEAIDAVQAGRLPEALEAIETSLTEDPNDPETWQLYVVILNAVGRTEDAKKATIKLKELGLGEADDFLLQASQAAGSGDLKSAISLYESAIASDPARPEAHAGHAFALLQNGDDELALASAETAVSLAPEDPRANYVLGHILRLAGESDRALIALTNAIKAEPELMIALYEQGMIFTEKDRLEEALKNFERFLEKHPDDESAVKAVAGVKARLGRTETF